MAEIKINKAARETISRIEKATLNPKLDKKAVEAAFRRQYKLLELDFPKEVVWREDLLLGFRDCTDAAWDAAWGAAAINTGLKTQEVLKWIAISTEELKALESGLAWFFPMKDKLILVPLPKFSFDGEKRLHSENGPAIDWENGAKFYFIHGTRVTEKIAITPKKLTKNDWLKERNTEVRRIIQDRMPDFPKKLGAKTLDKDSRGELLEVGLDDDPEKVATYIKVKDSSASRVYYLRVPPTTKTPTGGITWTFGLSGAEYNPTKET